MTEFNIASPSTVDGLKDALIANGGLNYFDEITAESASNGRKTTLTKGSLSVYITDVTTGYNTVDGTALTYMRTLSKGYATDSAIVIFGTDTSNLTAYAWPIIIFKTVSGDPVVFHCIADSTARHINAPGFDPNSDYVARLRCITLTSSSKITNTSNFCQYNNSNNYLTTASLPSVPSSSKDVYFCTTRPFASILNPFMLSINGESYASFAYNSILVKTE